MKKLNSRVWKRFLAVGKPFWFSTERWVARGLLLLLIVMLAIYTYTTVAIGKRTGELTSALADKDGNRFWDAILPFVIVLLIAIPINAGYYLVRDKLAIYWRRWMTRQYLGHYFGNRAYYDLTSNPAIDNPDQRIADDISNFTFKSLSFFLIAVNGLMALVGHGMVLWDLSKVTVFALAIYAVVGTLVTTFVFGKPLTGLNFTQLKREADFRFSLIRVRENAESIAFYQGELREAGLVKDRFGEAFRNYNKLLTWQFYLAAFQYANSYVIYVLPYLILAGPILANELEVGRLVQAGFAFTAILAALNLVIDHFDSLSKFTAGIDRLDSFVKTLKSSDPRRQDPNETVIESKEGDEFRLENVTLKTPGGERVLIDDVSLTIEKGSGLVISGPSGCGKSSLLRAIAGLWNAGSGTVVRPKMSEILFLPQRPYMVLGTLRTQLLYPKTELVIPDDELVKMLKTVNLQHLTEKEDGLDAELDWSKVLSIGEQQRLSFARLLLIKPKYAILDEATSALDQANEEMLYEQLEGTDTTLISVTHHPAVLQYHRQVLQLLGEGKWKLEPCGPGTMTKPVLNSGEGILGVVPTAPA